ncbi:hypothetical protein D3C80_1661400 [compost metagenome]
MSSGIKEIRTINIKPLVRNDILFKAAFSFQSALVKSTCTVNSIPSIPCQEKKKTLEQPLPEGQSALALSLDIGLF